MLRQMNDKIKQLATEVGISVEYLTNTKQWSLIEALAKRIVAESIHEVEGMAITMDSGHDQWNRAVVHTALHLQDYWGIEVENPAEQALNRMADNARDLGLDY